MKDDKYQSSFDKKFEKLANKKDMGNSLLFIIWMFYFTVIGISVWSMFQ